MTEITPALITRHRIEPGWWFGLSLTAQWRDTDGYGHINHRAYLAWCEEARNRYLEAVGLPRLAIDQPSPVLKSIGFEYAKSLRYGDEVVATAAVASFRKTSFRMRYAVWHDGLVGRGEALVILMLNSTGERVPIPELARQKMMEVDRAISE